MMGMIRANMNIALNMPCYAEVVYFWRTDEKTEIGVFFLTKHLLSGWKRGRFFFGWRYRNLIFSNGLSLACNTHDTQIETQYKKVLVCTLFSGYVFFFFIFTEKIIITVAIIIGVVVIIIIIIRNISILSTYPHIDSTVREEGEKDESRFSNMTLYCWQFFQIKVKIHWKMEMEMERERERNGLIGCLLFGGKCVIMRDKVPRGCLPFHAFTKL